MDIHPVTPTVNALATPYTHHMVTPLYFLRYTLCISPVHPNLFSPVSTNVFSCGCTEFFHGTHTKARHGGTCGNQYRYTLLNFCDIFQKVSLGIITIFLSYCSGSSNTLVC